MKKLLACLTAVALIAVPVPAQAFSGDDATVLGKSIVVRSKPTPHVYFLLQKGNGWWSVSMESYALCGVGEMWPSCTNWWAGYNSTAVGSDVAPNGK